MAEFELPDDSTTNDYWKDVRASGGMLSPLPNSEDGSYGFGKTAEPDPPTAEELNIPPEAHAASIGLPMLPPGEGLNQDHWDEVDQANTTRINELHDDFVDRQNAILHDGPDAYFNMAGRDAILAAPEVHGKLDALREEMLGRTTNVLQRKTLGEMLDEARIVNHSDIGWFAGKQSLAWRKGVQARRLDQLRRRAVLNHDMPGAVETWADLAEPAAREHARLSGLGQDTPEAGEFVAGTRSGLYRAAIEAAITKDNRRAAIRIYNQAKDKLAPEHAEYLKRLVTEARLEAVAEQYVGKLKVPPPDIATVGEIEQAQEAATKQNDTDWKDDDAQRDTNRHYIEVKFGKAQREAAETKARIDEAVRQWVTEPGSDGQPQTERPPMLIWARLSSDEQQAVDDALERNAMGMLLLEHGSDIMLAQADKPKGDDPRKELDRRFGRLSPPKEGDRPEPKQIIPPVPPILTRSCP